MQSQINGMQATAVAGASSSTTSSTKRQSMNNLMIVHERKPSDPQRGKAATALNGCSNSGNSSYSPFGKLQQSSKHAMNAAIADEKEERRLTNAEICESLPEEEEKQEEESYHPMRHLPAQPSSAIGQTHHRYQESGVSHRQQLGQTSYLQLSSEGGGGGDMKTKLLSMLTQDNYLKTNAEAFKHNSLELVTRKKSPSNNGQSQLQHQLMITRKQLQHPLQADSGSGQKNLLYFKDNRNRRSSPSYSPSHLVSPKESTQGSGGYLRLQFSSPVVGSPSGNINGVQMKNSSHLQHQNASVNASPDRPPPPLPPIVPYPAASPLDSKYLCALASTRIPAGRSSSSSSSNPGEAVHSRLRKGGLQGVEQQWGTTKGKTKKSTASKKQKQKKSSVSRILTCEQESAACFNGNNICGGGGDSKEKIIYLLSSKQSLLDADSKGSSSINLNSTSHGSGGGYERKQKSSSPAGRPTAAGTGGKLFGSKKSLGNQVPSAILVKPSVKPQFKKKRPPMLDDATASVISSVSIPGSTLNINPQQQTINHPPPPPPPSHSSQGNGKFFGNNNPTRETRHGLSSPMFAAGGERTVVSARTPASNLKEKRRLVLSSEIVSESSNKGDDSSGQFVSEQSRRLSDCLQMTFLRTTKILNVFKSRELKWEHERRSLIDEVKFLKNLLNTDNFEDIVSGTRALLSSYLHSKLQLADVDPAPPYNRSMI